MGLRDNLYHVSETHIRVYFDKIFFDDTVHLQKSKYGFILVMGE